ncbi:SAM-dependent chlorinase/fluorinase [Cyanobacterium sp. Dongsha4]|uniref:SAM hydrolase/SAM-dependent halogenase family protein n=1 Tax=Cyanobacterium sp. DS4 TaxID=2878255 RepID=UPI002E8139C4|nr:SAM-dependent chlorinase/fluorinase [Cyanobacterium sp. Dongsha4]WVL00695.1 SAM-dependent chlorinase/fluorinase [Cyanobacterium sp. Dongsha4]
MITLLTDFGLQDIYVGVMKGIIKTINPDIDIIDLTHDIPPQNISAASFALANSVDFFPDDTIHLAIVDPTVGSDRKIVAIAFEKGYIICPNNGIITGVLNRYQPQQIYELTNSNYWLNQSPSNTFHGRDIFAPMTAYLSKGIGLKTLGHNLNKEDLVILDDIYPIIKEKEIIGSIQYIDTYGNLITNITAKMLENKYW